MSPQPLLVAGRRPQSSHRSPYHLDAGEIMLLVVMCVVVPCCHVLCRHMKMQTAGLFKTWSRFFFVVERGILEAFSGEHVCCPLSHAMQLNLKNYMARLAPHLFSRPALTLCPAHQSSNHEWVLPLRDAMLVAESSNNCAISIITIERGTLHLMCDSASERVLWMEAIEGNVGAIEEAVEAAALSSNVHSDSVIDEQERMFMEQEALTGRMATAQGRTMTPQPAPLANPVDFDFKAIIAAAKDAQATGKKGSYVQGKVQPMFAGSKK